MCLLLAETRRSYRLVPSDEMAKVSGTAMHGGVVALAHPRPLLSFVPEAVADWAAEGGMLVVLDGVGNPHNLGAIARTAAFMGVKRLLLSRHDGQALPSDAAYRVAKGGLEWLDVFVTGDLPAALAALRPHFQVTGTALERATPLADLKRDARPVALVLGNEEEGLPRATLTACETVLTLPGSGHVQSLNVAVTAGILMFALAPQSGA
jgi:RNA methyltransferase, TrmH family